MEGDASPEVESLAIRVRLALTQTGLFVAPLIRSPKSESVYLEVSVARGGKRLAVIRISDHPPKSAKRCWRYLATEDNWARLVIELAKRARLAPPSHVFKEDERWRSSAEERRSLTRRSPPRR